MTTPQPRQNKKMGEGKTENKPGRQATSSYTAPILHAPRRPPRLAACKKSGAEEPLAARLEPRGAAPRRRSSGAPRGSDAAPFAKKACGYLTNGSDNSGCAGLTNFMRRVVDETVLVRVRRRGRKMQLRCVRATPMVSVVRSAPRTRLRMAVAARRAPVKDRRQDHPISREDRPSLCQRVRRRPEGVPA